MISWSRSSSTSTSTLDALGAKDEEFIGKFREHEQAVHELQRRALQDIVPDISHQLDLSEEDVKRVVDYLGDTGAFSYCGSFTTSVKLTSMS